MDTFTPTELLYWSTLSASVFSAAAGVLDARGKQFDLFGVMIIAFCAALGGGTLRDVLLDRPVFWIHETSYLVITWISALATFYLARWVRLASAWFLIPDAAALALYTVSGTQAALDMGAGWLVASFMGVITAVAGGILRDILCNEEPLVFNSDLYATAAWIGSLTLMLLYKTPLPPLYAGLITIAVVFLLRVSAIRWHLSLPTYKDKVRKR